jgi:hypothetical protein
MRNVNDEQSTDKVSMGLAVFIALCVVGLFCAVSIAIMENIDTTPTTNKDKHINLPNNKEINDFLL